MEINFECKSCGCIFDCDIGAVILPENSDRPHFEKKIICPECGERSMDEVLLTELGQRQLTEATLDFEVDDFFGLEHGEVTSFGLYEGECQGCDIFQPLNDLGLCEACAGKLERDLIRDRDWDYSALAYAVPPSKREELRKEIVARYGEKLELIAPKREAQRQKKRKKRKGKRKKAGSGR